MHRLQWHVWRVIAILCMVTMLAPISGLASSAASKNTVAQPQSGNVVQTIVQGAYVPPIVYMNTEIAAFNTLVGKNAGIIMEYYPWQLDLDTQRCGYLQHFFAHDRVTQCGGQAPGPEIHAALMLSWEPNSNPQNYPSCNVFVNGKTNLDAIINGSCDGYVANFATAIKNWSKTYGDVFLIRFAHEMNITDSIWWANDPNQPARYVAAFQRIRNLFIAAGATNQYAQFVWSPNYASSPNVAWNAIPNYYPGDAYVDWIGLSGYNWGNTRSSGWKTFSDIYDKADPNLGDTGVLRYLMCHYTKPIILAEIGSVEGPGGTQTKAAWIADAFAKIQNFPYVRAITWFNDYAYHAPSQPDFRVTAGSSYSGGLHTGSQSALYDWTQAYKTAISSATFVSTLPPLSSLTPASAYCGPIPPLAASLDGPSFLLAEKGDTIEAPVTLNGVNESVTLSVNGALPSGYTVSFSPPTLGPTAVSIILMTIHVPAYAAVPNNISLTVKATGSSLSLSDTTTLMVRSTIHHVGLPVVLRP